MKVFKGISSFILSLLLVFLIIFLQVSFFVNTKLLKQDFYVSKFEKQGFYDYLYDSIQKNFEQVSRKSNLPQELFSDIVTKDWVKQQLDNSIKDTIGYMLYQTEVPFVLDIKPQGDKFNQNIDNYIKGLNIKIDKNSEKEIQSIKDQISNIIKSQVNFINITSFSKNSSFQYIRRGLYYIYYWRVIIFGIILINMLLILLATDRSFNNFAAWIGYSMIAGGLFTLIPSSIGGLSGFINNIAISNGTLKQLVIAFAKDFLMFFNITGGIIFIAGIMLTIFAVLHQNSRIKQSLL
jgi:hypothetical protein